MGGAHNPRLDELKDGVWRYRIRGNATDGRELQIAVIIDSPVVVVTVISS